MLPGSASRQELAWDAPNEPLEEPDSLALH